MSNVRRRIHPTMTPSILGSALGVGVGALLCAFALVASQRSRLVRSNSSVQYPSPDWPGFIKVAASLAAFLIFLHWAPELASLLSQALQNKSLVVAERGFEATLFVAHALALTGITTSFLGALWATWQASRSRQRSGSEPTSSDA